MLRVGDRSAVTDDYSRRTVLGATGGVTLTALPGGRLLQQDPENGRGPPGGSDVESLAIERVGRYETGEFDGGAEIVAYDAARSRLFVVNSGAGRVEVLDVSDPAAPEQVAVIDAAGDVPDGGGANSVDVVGDLVAVAVENEDPQAPGFIALYDASSLQRMALDEVGPLPDKVTISPDGNYVLSANEGEPATDEEPGSRTDPGGSVSIIDVSDGVGGVQPTTLDFTPFDEQVESLRREGVRVYGASAEDDDPKPSTDFEPEFITVASDSETAFVSLQENNAIATVDIPNAEITDVSGLGFKDFSIEGNELDTSDADAGDADAISLQNWPVKGMYQPDAIAAHEVAGTQYVLTANEGDSRDFEETTVADLTLATDAFAPRLSENPYVDSVEGLQARRTSATWRSRTSSATTMTTASSRTSTCSAAARSPPSRSPTTAWSWCTTAGTSSSGRTPSSSPPASRTQRRAARRRRPSNSGRSGTVPSPSSASSGGRASSSTT